MQKIIRALAFVYACCVSDSATTQTVSIVVDSGSHALMVSHSSAVAFLVEKPTHRRSDETGRFAPAAFEKCKPQETST